MITITDVNAFWSPQRRVRTRRVMLAVCGSLLIGMTIGEHIGKHWKVGIDLASPRCLPWWLYKIHLEPQRNHHPGEYVAFWSIPSDLGPRYISFMNDVKKQTGSAHQIDNLLFGKKVVAAGNDKISIVNGNLYVNEKAVLVGMQLVEKYHHKQSEFDLQYTLKPDELFVIGTEPRSFDSRYWGPLKNKFVIGEVFPIL